MKKTTFSPKLTKTQQLYGWLYLFFQLLLLPPLIYSVAAGIGVSSEAVLNFVYYLLNFCFCTRIFRGLLRESVLNAGADIWGFLTTVCLGFAAYCLCAYCFTAVLAIVWPEFANVNDASISAMVMAHPILMGIGTVVLTPVAEECLYRGLVFTPLRHKNRTAAYAVSTLAFCAIHVVGYIGSFDTLTLTVCFLQYIPAGLCLAWAYDRTGSIFAPILIHGAVNLVSILSL